MSGIFGKLKKGFNDMMQVPGGESDDDYYDSENYDYEGGTYYEDDYDDYEEYEKPAASSRKQSTSRQSSSSRGYANSNNKVIPYSPSTSRNRPPSGEAIVVHPKNVHEAREIASHLRSGRMCIVDLTGVELLDAQRIADLICGVSIAIDGSITRVNNTIFTVAPLTYRVMDDGKEGREEFAYDGSYSDVSNDR
jgi:cell division inhibitor SepF